MKECKKPRESDKMQPKENEKKYRTKTKEVSGTKLEESGVRWPKQIKTQKQGTEDEDLYGEQWYEQRFLRG